MLFSVKRRRTSNTALSPLTFRSSWRLYQSFRVTFRSTPVSLKTQSLSHLDLSITTLWKIRGPQQTSPTDSFPRSRSNLTAISIIWVIEILSLVIGTLQSLPTQGLQNFLTLPPPLMNKTSPRSPAWRKTAGVVRSCLLHSLAPASARTSVSARLAQRNGEYPLPPFQFPALVQCASHAGSPAASRCVKLWVT